MANQKRAARRAGVTTARQQRQKRIARVRAVRGTKQEWSERQRQNPELSRPKNEIV